MPDSAPRRRPVLQPRSSKAPPYSVEAAGVAKVAGETIPRRHPSAKDGLLTRPDPSVATVYDILCYGAEKHGNADAAGTRRILNTHVETKKTTTTDANGEEHTVEKKWSFYELSDYEYISFVDFKKSALRAGAAMRKLGLEPQDRVEVYGATSLFWFTVAHGASSQSITIVTAYDTLGDEGLTHSLKQTKAKAIFLDPSLLPRVTKALANATDVKAVVYNDGLDIDQSHLDQLKKQHPSVSVLAYSDFMESADTSTEPVPPTEDDLACIMYTSGSTGPPKGVLLKHKTVISAIAGVDAVVGPHIGPGDRMLAYLPLAHIIEFMFENASIFWGGVLGYGSPRTLTDASVRKCKGDIPTFKPSVMVGVPAVWETVKKGILSRVNASFITQKVFWAAMAAKQNLLYWNIPGTGLIDHLVFNKIKAATGGNLRLVLNGGGPIAQATLRFISFAICPMLGGYGLTETAGMGAINDPLAWTDGALGCVEPSIEVKLVDVPDLNYTTDHDPPQGEVWIRGGAVIEGYLENPEETAKAFSDGWFKTGDIGEFDKTGQLRIIDRKKNLVKTLNGEYIALEKLESLYRSTAVVANICVYASPDEVKPVAIIAPAEPALKKLAASIGVADKSIEELCSNDKVRSTVLQELLSIGKKSGLSGFELVQGVVLSEEEWTPQNQLVTNAQKLNRKAVLERFQKQIDEAYKKGGS